MNINYIIGGLDLKGFIWRLPAKPLDLEESFML
jgi:hypothetical protein